jgi:hypothetical protein
MATARIIPSGINDADGYQLTRGTVVMVGGGELTGITKITLVGGVDDVWRATIECLVKVEEIDGVKVENITNLKSEAAEHRKAS